MTILQSYKGRDLYVIDQQLYKKRKTSMELYQHFYSIIVCSSCKDLFEVNAEHPFTQL